MHLAFGLVRGPLHHIYFAELSHKTKTLSTAGTCVTNASRVGLNAQYVSNFHSKLYGM